MNTPNPPNAQTDLSRVLEKITEIATASTNGVYIYRGESETHDKVSSNLYREYKKDEVRFTKHVDKIYGFKVEFRTSNKFLAREHIQEQATRRSTC